MHEIGSEVFCVLVGRMQILKVEVIFTILYDTCKVLYLIRRKT